MKLKVVLSILAFWAQNVKCISSKHIGDLDHVSEEFHSEESKNYFADETAEEDRRRFLANNPITVDRGYNQKLFESTKTVTFRFSNIPVSSSAVTVTFAYSGDINERDEIVSIKNWRGNTVKVIGRGNLRDSKCGNPARRPNNKERREHCCTVTEQKTFSKDFFNRLRKRNGNVIFEMEFPESVDVTTCRTNRGQITFTPPETQAPAPTLAPIGTTNVIIATESEVTTEGASLAECQTNLQTVKASQESAAQGAVTALCNGINCEIDVSSSVTPCAQQRRQLKMTSSRLLQASFQGTVVTTTTVTALENAVNANTLQQNIGQAISAALANNQNVVSQSTSIAPAPVATPVAPPVYVEPPSPCEGVNCNNAGKCEVTSHTTALCTCENTFVVSESGLGCECPPGHEFNADVNRCLPPPTAAPTKSPTISPTSAPTTPPTTSPTAEVVPIEVCEDDMNATFPLINVDKQVNCEWLYKNNAEDRKEMYCGLNQAKLVCPKTCNFCTCEDSSSYTFELMYVDDPDKKTQDCTWLTRNWMKKEDRIARYCTEDFDDGKLVNACTKSCGLCLEK